MYALASSFPDLLESCLTVFTTRIQPRFSLGWAHACSLFNSAHASVMISSSDGETSLLISLLEKGDCFMTPFHLPSFGAGRLFQTWAATLLSYAVTAHCSSSGCFCIFLLLSQYLDLTHCGCSVLFKRTCTFPATVFSTYTMEEIWHLTHGALTAQQRCYLSYTWSRNTGRGRIDFTCHPQLLKKYWCAQEHLLFYALTYLFPSISRYKRSHTRATKKHGDSNDDPIFSQAHFHCQITHSPGSCNSHNDGSYKDLRTFAAQSRINSIPTRPLHVTSLKDPLLCYHCVPHIYEEASFSNQCMLCMFLSPSFQRLVVQFSPRIFSPGFPIFFQKKEGMRILSMKALKNWHPHIFRKTKNLNFSELEFYRPIFHDFSLEGKIRRPMWKQHAKVH